jgi:hypothetical protein
MFKNVSTCWLVTCALAAFCATASGVSATQNRSYVVSWFHVATFLQDDDCPNGPNPMAAGIYTRILTELGPVYKLVDA